MAINFPDNPTVGQTFTSANRTWTYNGSAWVGDYSSTGNADTIDGIDSSQFLRNDVNGTLYTTSGDTNFTIQGHESFDPILTLKSNQGAISTEGVELWYDNSVGDMHLSTTYANDAAAIRFHTRVGASKSIANERLTIGGNGNVGVAVSTPQYNLDVRGPVNNFAASFGTTLGTTQWTGIHFGYSETPNALYRKSAIVFERTDASGGGGNAAGKVHILNGPAIGAGSATLADARLTIGELGNIGINNTAPRTKLTIDAGNVAGTQELLNLHNQSTGTGHGTSLTFSGWTTTTAYPTWRFSGIKGLYDTTSAGLNAGGFGGRLNFFVNRGGSATQFEDVMTITGGSRVGIGTTNPTSKLQVNGTVTATSFSGDGSALTGIAAGVGLFKGDNGERGDTTNGAGDIFRINKQTLASNVTIDADENASCTGPLTIGTGVTLVVNGNLTVV